jgi:hypothetical protein
MPPIRPFDFGSRGRQDLIMNRGGLALFVGFAAQLASACAMSPMIVDGLPVIVDGLPTTIPCPVSDIEIARSIAASVIAGQPDSFRQNQNGYRIDVRDEGRFWSVRDGPNAVTTAEGLMRIQFSGSSVSFKVAKCSGAISDFTMLSWK